jgi:uroporphyrinogen-III synthase
LKEGKRFFFEKKKQKTFVRWLSGAPAVVRTQKTDKSFLLLFFKKEVLPCF